MQPCVIPLIRSSFETAFTPAITFTQALMDTRLWRCGRSGAHQKRGSLLVSHKETVEHPGFAVKVVDAVGAGDAFTACLAHHLVRGRLRRSASL